MDFIKSFLEIKGFEAVTSAYATEGYSVAIREIPDLIIVNKIFKNDINAEGFLIKKRISGKIAKIPIFLTGDFSPEEIVKYKEENVKSFLSIPLNPIAFFERIVLFFELEHIQIKKQTPMLLDIHVKGNIIITQIEGNLEPEKIELFNYLVRCFCKQKGIKSPKFFFIIPSLYPDNITDKNVEILFKFSTYPELEIKKRSIQILTRNSDFIKALKLVNTLPHYELAENYFSGMSILQIDFDKRKTVPVDFLKLGSMYIFDLYDSQGKKYVPALTNFTQKMLDKINDAGINHLTYFHEKNLVEVKGNPGLAQSEVNQKKLFEFITQGFEPIETELHAVKLWDEKQTLFFTKMKGQKILVMSNDDKMKNLIQETLGLYFNIFNSISSKGLDESLEETRYSIIFIDTNCTFERKSALDILKSIRAYATRRKTSVIILATKIDKTTVVKFKNSGTDNILLYPFSSSKVLNTVFTSVNSDRRT